MSTNRMKFSEPLCSCKTGPENINKHRLLFIQCKILFIQIRLKRVWFSANNNYFSANNGADRPINADMVRYIYDSLTAE